MNHAHPIKRQYSFCSTVQWSFQNVAVAPRGEVRRLLTPTKILCDMINNYVSQEQFVVLFGFVGSTTYVHCFIVFTVFERYLSYYTYKMFKSRCQHLRAYYFWMNLILFYFFCFNYSYNSSLASRAWERVMMTTENYHRRT